MKSSLGWVLMLAGAASSAQAVEPAARKVLTLHDVAVSMAWSSSWKLEEAAPPGMPGTVEFHAPDRLQMLALLTPVEGATGLAADAAMRELVTKSSAQFREQAVEKEIKLRRISRGEAHGYFVCFTDKAPKPDEYQFLCQGVVSLRELPISFTLLYNEGGKSDAERVLSALKTLQAADQT